MQQDPADPELSKRQTAIRNAQHANVPRNGFFTF
jgi:hypothetical protein